MKSFKSYEKIIEIGKRENAFKIIFRKNNHAKLSLSFIQELFPIFIINSLVYKFYLESGKKKSKWYMMGSSIIVVSYVYMVFIYYGEEKLFYKNMIREDVIGYYLRKKFLENFEEHEFSKYFYELNDKISISK